MKAELLTDRRITLGEDVFAEIVIWKLHKPLPGCRHRYKYRVAYVVRGVCVLRYDNETGKGDHRHLGARERLYEFVDIDRLLSDFRRDVTRWNDENRDS